MGVPTFFKWLSMRYPTAVLEGTDSVFKTQLPQFDSFYVDLNGIIHGSVETQRGEVTSEGVVQSLLQTLDTLVNLIKPKKLLFLAIDGVAPRAKMNQQRARRYKKARDRRPQNFDSNMITPGTEFMDQLSAQVHNAIVYKLDRDWRHLTVIFSDSNNPGEGEHKIVEFIRSQRQQRDYNPNTKHCVYGADADLIMLGLALHEAHFFILRESFFGRMYCVKCGKSGHEAARCAQSGDYPPRAKFQVVSLPVLREYLYFEFEELRKYPNFDFERIVDDFVFLCFFVGNDFLPSIPNLSIRNGAIDCFIYVYIYLFPRLGDYITDSGKVNLDKIDILLRKLASIEQDWILQQRRLLNRFNQMTVQKIRYPDGASQNVKNIIAAKQIQQDLEIMLQEDEIRIGEEGWKIRYYHDKFNISEDEFEEFRAKIHMCYMEGLVWVFKYYYTGCES